MPDNLLSSTRFTRHSNEALCKVLVECNKPHALPGKVMAE